MTTNMSNKIIRLSDTVKRLMYGVMIALAGYFFLSGNTGYAAIYLGLALIFNPFKQEQSLPNRPL